jgi:hypothetical protein
MSQATVDFKKGKNLYCKIVSDKSKRGWGEEAEGSNEKALDRIKITHTPPSPFPPFLTSGKMKKRTTELSDGKKTGPHVQNPPSTYP